MKQLEFLSAGLATIGAINRGLSGLFHLDVVAAVLDRRWGATSVLSSTDWWASGLHQALTWKSIHRRWRHSAAAARA